MKSLYFKVADAYYAVQFTDDNADYKSLLASSVNFNVSRPEDLSQLMFTLTVGDGLVSTDNEGDPIGEFDCGGIMHTITRDKDGGYKIIISDGKGGVACAFRSNVDFSECRCTLFGNTERQHFGIGNANMIAFAFAGAHHGILLMHASVPVKDGYGYLCLGKSGTGKSTHSSLWLKHIPETELLNDDNPAVAISKDGDIKVYGTPWSGKTPCYRNTSAKVGGFLRLHQAPENAIYKCLPLESFASILSSCSTMIWDKPSYTAICDTISEITKSVSVYDLRCLPDEAAARLSYSTMHHPEL